MREELDLKWISNSTDEIPIPNEKTITSQLNRLAPGSVILAIPDLLKMANVNLMFTNSNVKISPERLVITMKLKKNIIIALVPTENAKSL